MEVNSGSGGDFANAAIPNASGGDLDESSAHIELTALPTGGRCDVAWTDATETGYRIRFTPTEFTWARLAAGVPTTLSGPTTWSAASHKWFRIREVGGTTFLE